MLASDDAFELRKGLVKSLLRDPEFLGEFAATFSSKTIEEKFETVEFLFGSRVARNYCPGCKLDAHHIKIGCSCAGLKPVPLDLKIYRENMGKTSDLVGCVDTLNLAMNSVVDDNPDIGMGDVRVDLEVVEVQAVDMSGSTVVLADVAPVIVPPASDTSVVYSDQLMDQLVGQEKPYGDIYLSLVVDKISKSIDSVHVFEGVKDGLDAGCPVRHIHTHDPDEFTRSASLPSLHVFVDKIKSVVTGSDGPPIKILTPFNIKECLDSEPKITGGGPSGVDQDVLLYFYDDKPWVVNLRDPIGALNVAETLFAKIHASGGRKVSCVQYNPYRIDWTLFSLLYSPLGALKGRRGCPLFVPGLTIPDAKRVVFQQLLDTIKDSIQVTHTDAEKLRKEPTLSNYYYVMCRSSVDISLVDRLFSFLGYHREWMRARILLVLCREYKLPGYLERYALSIIGRSTGVPVTIRCARSLTGWMQEACLSYEDTRTKEGGPYAFYFGEALLSRISRPKGCVHNTGWYSTGFRRKKEIQVLRSFRVSGLCKHDCVGDCFNKGKLCDDTCGVLSYGSKVLDSRPIIVVAWIPYSEAKRLAASEHTFWSRMIVDTGSPHPAHPRQFDELMYGLDHCLVFNGRGVYDGIANHVDDYVIMLLVLLSYDMEAWKKFEIARFRTNALMRFLNTYARCRQRDKDALDNGFDKGRYFKDGCSLLITEN